jgi:hypothetical protein
MSCMSWPCGTYFHAPANSRVVMSGLGTLLRDGGYWRDGFDPAKLSARVWSVPPWPVFILTRSTLAAAARATGLYGAPACQPWPGPAAPVERLTQHNRSVVLRMPAWRHTARSCETPDPGGGHLLADDAANALGPGGGRSLHSGSGHTQRWLNRRLQER